jgi:hypothetical protein
MFDDYPTCVFGLGFSVQNFAKAGKVEIGDPVISFPFQIDTQSRWRNILVYAHNKGSIGDFFHVWCFLWLAAAQVLPGLRSQSDRCVRSKSQLLKNGDGLKHIRHPERSGIVCRHT